MSDAKVERLLLVESLPLLATYVSSPSVEIGPHAVGIRSSIDGSDDTELFLREVQVRHASASATTLQQVLDKIERRYSNSTELVRSESRGIIRGRLDVPRYIAHRLISRSLPRTYPIVTNEHSPETTENALVCSVLRGLNWQLGRNPFPWHSAESQSIRECARWTQARLRRFPWCAIHRTDTIDRLRRETDIRIRKRQTGNEPAYEDLIEWIDEWIIAPEVLGSAMTERVVNGLLSFPTSDIFWDKVFEVWTLGQVRSAFLRIGLTSVEATRPLYDRGQGPIFRFLDHIGEIRIWFQRQYPLPSGRWAYVDGGPLVGIPDVVLTSDGRSPLIIDAKYRWVTSDTRSEETYKMLGYFENFHESGSTPSFGALIFPGLARGASLAGPNGSGLDLVVFDLMGDRNSAQSHLDDLIRRWLDQ